MTTDISGDFSQFLAARTEAAEDSGVELLLASMRPDSAQQLRLCAIPQLFTPRILAVLVPSLELSDAEKRCEEFAHLSIVSESPFGLVLHRSVRRELFASWLRDDRRQEFRAASRRLASYFSRRIAELEPGGVLIAQRSYIFHLIGADPQRGVEELYRAFNAASSQFDTAECQLLLELAREYEPVLDRPQRAIVDYCDGKLAADEQRWRDAVALFERVASGTAPEEELHAKAHERLGLIYKTNRKWPKAIAQLSEALAVARRQDGSEALQVRIMQNLGATYRDAGQYAKAEKLLNDCLQLNAKLGNKTGLAFSLTSLGLLHRQLGQWEEAIAEFDRSRELLEELGSPYRLAQLLNNIGLVYADKLDWDASERAFQKSLELRRKSGDVYGEAKTLNNLVRVKLAGGSLDGAVESAQRAVALFEKIGAMYSLAVAKHNLARLYTRRAQTEAADRALREAKDIFSRLKYAAEVDSIERELKGLYQKEKVPWLVKAAIILCILFILLGILVSL